MSGPDPSAPARLRRRIAGLRGDGTRTFGRGRETGSPDSRYDSLPSPPLCPPGWRTGPPDFVIMGAQKSGTTWWQGLIETHPGVTRPKGQRRELHWFDHFWDRWPTAEQLQAYREHFPRPDGAIVGEKTPGYMYQPWVAPMLAAVAPKARLICILRDPVARYVSGLGLLERAGALKAAPGQGEVGQREHRVTEAIERGRYAGQLRWLLLHFPREQLLVLQYERCVADPQGQLARTFDFLGLPTHEVSADDVSVARKRSSGSVDVPPELRRLLADLYRSDLAELAALVPDLDPDLWPSLAAS